MDMVTLPPLRRRAVALAPAVDQQIDRGNEKHGDDNGDGESADERAGERSVLLAAGFEAERQRDHAEEGGEEVIRMGRIRILQDCTTASTRLLPWA